MRSSPSSARWSRYSKHRSRRPDHRHASGASTGTRVGGPDSKRCTRPGSSGSLVRPDAGFGGNEQEESRRARRDENAQEALREEGRKQMRGELKAKERQVAGLKEHLRLAEREAESLRNSDRSELQEGSLYDQIRGQYPSDDVKRIGRRGA